jgi:hypothetical protein
MDVIRFRARTSYGLSAKERGISIVRLRGSNKHYLKPSLASGIPAGSIRISCPRGTCGLSFAAQTDPLKGLLPVREGSHLDCLAVVKRIDIGKSYLLPARAVLWQTRA